MASTPKITLDQWAALVSVVESGSYAKASEHLHKSQSTLTYAIQKLEELLDVKVFELQGRRSVLTQAGMLLYRRAKSLIEEAGRVERTAAELARGWEAEIRLAVEIIYPTWLLLRCLQKFSEERPDTRIELVESVLGGTDEALLQHKVDFAIGPSIPAGFTGDLLMPVLGVCAAAPSHPLHRLGRPLTLEDLRPYRHLIIRDTGVQRDRVVGWQNENRWTVSSKATAIRAAVMGLGFAWFVEDMIREELEQGSLARLPLREGAERTGSLFLIYPDREACGPGARRLVEIIREETRLACKAEKALEKEPSK
jgi:DNA-binding transcriptional LysR family regulator